MTNYFSAILSITHFCFLPKYSSSSFSSIFLLLYSTHSLTNRMISVTATNTNPIFASVFPTESFVFFASSALLPSSPIQVKLWYFNHEAGIPNSICSAVILRTPESRLKDISFDLSPHSTSNIQKPITTSTDISKEVTPLK